MDPSQVAIEAAQVGVVGTLLGGVIGIVGAAVVEWFRGSRERELRRQEWRREAYAEYLATVDEILRAKLGRGLLGQVTDKATGGLTGSSMNPAVFKLAQAFSRLQVVCGDPVKRPAQAVLDAATDLALVSTVLTERSKEIIALAEAKAVLATVMRQDLGF